ncbi:MAG: sugar phosphate isomerase/epimerase [Acidobacteriota bacterium]|nr:sugar phosphate isomerase/epimerase [Acidobacteriota bacterium]
MNRRQLLAAVAAFPAAAQSPAGSKSGYRFRAGLVAYSYRKALAAKTLTYEDLIRRVADWGLDGLDCTVYWFPDTSAAYLASLRKAAFRHAVQIYNAGVRVQLAQPTAELQQAEFENIRKWVDVADRLGAGHVRVFGGNIPKGATEEQAIGWAAEVLRRGADYAGTKGILLGVENDYGLTVEAAATAAIVKRAGSAWAGVNADTGNLRKDGYRQLEILLPYVTSVHLKSMVSAADGSKEAADWPRLLRILGASGYQGYAGLEYEGDEPDADIPRLARELRAAVRTVSAG